MLGPRSRSEIDFLEKKVRKSFKHRDPPCLATCVISDKSKRKIENTGMNEILQYNVILRDITQVAKRGESP